MTSMSELIVILIVALLVLPPAKWPMLLYHMAKLIRWINTTKETILDMCKTQIQEYELKQNQHHAEQADKHYSNEIFK